MPQLKKTMFREYDLRGLESPDELNDDSMYYIGKGFGTYLNQLGIKQAIAGHDARSTSESFHQQIIKGLTESGIDVVDIGTITTPMGYWAQYHFKVKGLVIVTASHNPAGWNGVKLGTDLSYTLLTDELQDVYKIIASEKFAEGRTGKVRQEDVLEEYVKDLSSRVKLNKKFKVLINTGNGTAGIVTPKLFRAVGCEVIEHLTNSDPTYPHYTPNPEGTKMMEDTSAQVIKNKCDIGLAIDGDGDRLGMTDEKGNIVWADRFMILLSRLILSKKPGAKIIFDVKVSEALPEDIKVHGGQPIMWKTGHSYIKSKLAAENASLAGEMSGHIFFADGYYGFDDALFAALKLLEYLDTQTKLVSEIVDSIPYYISTPVIHIPTTDEDKYAIVEELVGEFKAEGYKVIDVSGGRVYTDKGWALVRASSNTPQLVVRFEAKSEAELEELKQLIKGKLKRFDKVSDEWDTGRH